MILFYLLSFLYILSYVYFEIAALPKSKKILDILWIDIPAVLILTYPIWHYPFSIYIFRGGDSQFLQIIKSYWLNLETSKIMFREGSLLIGLEIYRYIRYKKCQ